MTTNSGGGRVAEATVPRLIDEARAGNRESLGELLQLHCRYLTVLATSQMSQRLQARVSPADLVQETMLAVYRDFRQFRGDSEREFLAWLRQVFVNALRQTIATHVTAKKRDIRCEVPIDRVAADIDRSAIQTTRSLADPTLSPCASLRMREQCAALAKQLSNLKSDYREVIVLRTLEGLTFAEVAKRMKRKQGTVRMLWLRAIEKLKTACDPID